MDITPAKPSVQTDKLRLALLGVFGARDISGRQLFGYCIAFSVVGSLIITSFEPMVTAHLTLPLAVLCWFLHLFVAATCLTVVTALGVAGGMRMPWPLVAAVMLLPFLLAPFSIVADAFFDERELIAASSLSITQLYVKELVDISAPALGLSALMAVLAYRAADIAQKYRAERLLKSAPEPSLRQVIPSAPHSLGDDLIRVEAQDHYVRLITSTGAATVKLAFSECVAALAPFPGARCHSSHWVRFRHVKRIARAGSAYACVLDDGTEVPVSRRRYGELKRKV